MKDKILQSICSLMIIVCGCGERGLKFNHNYLFNSMHNIIKVKPKFETEPTRSPGDTADDICLWIHPNDRAKKYQGMLENQDFNVFYNAPCLVIILGLSELKNLYVDCASAANYFMMAATSRGLGTCWVNLGMEIHDPEMINELGIPENCTIVAPITVGYPERIPPAPKRKEPEVLTIISTSV